MHLQITEKFGIKDGTAFGVFEVSKDGAERALGAKERILDVVITVGFAPISKLLA